MGNAATKASSMRATNSFGRAPIAKARKGPLVTPSIKPDQNIVNDKRPRSAPNGTKSSQESSALSSANESLLDNKFPKSLSKTIYLRGLPPDVTESDVTALCRPFGQVASISLFKTIKGRGLVELDDIAAASRMVNYYESVPASIRDWKVGVSFSKHQEIRGRQPSEVGRSTPIVKFRAEPHTQQLSEQGSNLPNSSIPNFSSVAPQVISGPSNCLLHVTIDNVVSSLTSTVLNDIFSKYGNITLITYSHEDKYHALVQYQSVTEAMKARDNLNGRNIYDNGCTLHVEPSQFSSLSVMFNNKARSVSSHNSTSGQIVLVSNLNEEVVTPHDLFILFGLYGDVNKVKIHHKRDTAFVEYKEFYHAQTAISHLYGTPLHGKRLRISLSKHSQIHFHGGIFEDTFYAEDYSNSTLHRFKGIEHKYCQLIVPPKPTLYVSNISISIDETELSDIFSKCGGTVLNVAMFTGISGGYKWGLVEMKSIEEAVMAIIATHNYKCDDSSHLQVSFATKHISLLL